MNKLITAETLKLWKACSDGAARFNELFPDGADLKTASDGLIADGHPSWSSWLWATCKSSDDHEYNLQTVRSAGDNGTATAGDGGTISILFWDFKKQKLQRKIAKIGDDGFKPNTPYRLYNNGDFIEV